VAGLGPLQSFLAIWAHPHRSALQGRIQRSDTWSGEGFRSVSQSAHGRLPKIISAPIADVFEGGSQCPKLCHIVTRSRQLLLGVRFARQVLQRCRRLRRALRLDTICSNLIRHRHVVAVITLKVAGGDLTAIGAAFCEPYLAYAGYGSRTNSKLRGPSESGCPERRHHER